jgi:isopentenyl-diphosphate delta-isomerase
MCPVFVATTTDEPDTDPAEVEAWEWVSWPGFRDDVLAGRREVSQWCREQVDALPEDPLAAPAADPAGLPRAAR